MFSISIPKPCQENWDEMTPNDRGAFCNACSKTVIDFTSLNDEEVKNYFLAHSGQKTCGRFRDDQLSNGDLLKLLSSAVPFWKKFLAMLCIVFAALLTGCNHATKGKLKVEYSSVEKPGESKVTTTLGVLMPEITPGTTAIESCTSIGETIELISDTALIGDIEVAPEPIVCDDIKIELTYLVPDTLAVPVMKIDSLKNMKNDSLIKKRRSDNCDSISPPAIVP